MDLVKTIWSVIKNKKKKKGKKTNNRAGPMLSSPIAG
jgi:hypothetical protein